jgi:hypothetical protein
MQTVSVARRKCRIFPEVLAAFGLHGPFIAIRHRPANLGCCSPPACRVDVGGARLAGRSIDQGSPTHLYRKDLPMPSTKLFEIVGGRAWRPGLADARRIPVAWRMP